MGASAAAVAARVRTDDGIADSMMPVSIAISTITPETPTAMRAIQPRRAPPTQSRQKGSAEKYNMHGSQSATWQRLQLPTASAAACTEQAIRGPIAPRYGMISMYARVTVAAMASCEPSARTYVSAQDGLHAHAKPGRQSAGVVRPLRRPESVPLRATQ